MAQQHLNEAAERLLAGEVVDVVYASGALYHICIGDFRVLGWSERVVDRRSWGYRWLGPGTIRVQGQEYTQGQYLPRVDVDWT